MPTVCVSPVQGLVFRIVKADTCGRPVTGAGSVVVAKYAQIGQTFDYNEGEEFLRLNADGSPCVNDKDGGFLKRVLATVNLCNIDPDGLVIVTGETLITSGAPASGTGVAYSGNKNTTRFSLETWQAVSGPGACAGGAQNYLYWAWPNMGSAMLQDYDIENAPSELSFTAETKPAVAEWGDGPGTGAVWLPAGFNPTGYHVLHNVTQVAPPTPACGATALS